VTWLRVDPRILRQDDPRHRRIVYWDEDPHDVGQLFVWVDGTGDVARFQLSHRKFLTYRECVAEWHRGSDLRVGEVADGEGAAGVKRAPIMRYHRSDNRGLAQLRDYFARNAEALEPRHRAAIALVLGTDRDPPV
jgi:hypothetical protein